MNAISDDITILERRKRIGMQAQPVPYRDAGERSHDFAECALGFNIQDAIAEASRCIHCPDPAACVSACPMGNDIPMALWYVEHGEFVKAAELYRQTNPLPEICGRVCPAESTCAASCVLTKRGRGIATGAIESFVTDYQRDKVGVPLPAKSDRSGKRVAIIGSGPAGLAAAEDLAVAGHEVTIFDAASEPGGLLMNGIPNFKLDKSLVDWKTHWLTELGVRFQMNTRIGSDLSVDHVLDHEEYDAVFLATGAQIESKLDVHGEALGRVYNALDFLTRAFKLIGPYVGRRVAVIGGGDTATDCLRSAIRLGAESVTCYYRRSEIEMPGNKSERRHAQEEGVQFEYLVAPVELLDQDGDGNVDAIKLIRMELGTPDASGRRRPVVVAGSEYIVEVDAVVLAIGFWPDPTISKTTTGLEADKSGLIHINPATGETSRAGVFAGGDNVTGPALVNAAVAAGKRAACAINEYLS